MRVCESYTSRVAAYVRTCILLTHVQHFVLSFCRLTRRSPSLPFESACECVCVEHGPNNVSRWMTWLPISLKNAVKCDKWYELQNHLITESLNANGAWEKPLRGYPRACHILSVEHKNKQPRVWGVDYVCPLCRGGWRGWLHVQGLSWPVSCCLPLLPCTVGMYTHL